jgi:YVTN family beta-propeller protein
MEVRLLGPLEVVVDGRSTELRGRKQRTLLAILALHPNEPLSPERLIEALWPQAPPPSALNTLQGYISRLRQALDGTGDDGRGWIIASRPAGYALVLPPDGLDTWRFERLVAEAGRRASDGEAAEAASILTDALDLWRGPALADFAYESFAQAEIRRLEELRLKAIEDRIEAELSSGDPAGVVPELEALTARYPTRERLRSQLMLALYRCGRQDDALRVYQDARRSLHDELGLEPTPALRELQRAILAQDASLDPPSRRPPARPSRPRRVRRAWLVGIGLGVAIAAAAAVAALQDGVDRGGAHPAAVQVAPHSVAVVDPATNSVVADLRIGGWPRAVIRGGGYVWVARTGDDTLVRIDPAGLRVLDSVFATTPLDLAWSGDALWSANGNSFDGPDPPGGGTVERIDLRTRKLRRARVGPAVPGNGEQTVVAAGAEGVWAGNADTARVYQLDRVSGRVIRRVATTVQVAGIAVGHGSVWAADPINNEVLRIDARSARVVARIPVADGPRRLAVDASAVWVVGDFPKSGVWRIDPGVNRAVAHVDVPPRANWIGVDGSAVWVTSHTPGHQGPGSVTRVDPKTNAVVATVPLGFSPEGVVVAHGLVWVVVGPS